MSDHDDEATGIEDEPEVIIAEAMARRARSEDTSPDAETVSWPGPSTGSTARRRCCAICHREARQRCGTPLKYQVL